MNCRQNCENNFLKYSIILFIIITTSFVTFYYYKKRTSVYFIDLYSKIDYQVDHKKKLFLKKSKYYDLNRSLNNLSPGPHLIFYNASPVTRYYAPIEVNEGKNFIKPVFNYHSLPSLSVFKSFSKKSKNKTNNKKTFKYSTFSGTTTENNNTLTIDIDLEVKKISKNFLYEFGWEVTLNDKLISIKNLKKKEIIKKAGNKTKQIIYKDSTHYYYVEYYFSEGAAKLKIGSEYI